MSPRRFRRVSGHRVRVVIVLALTALYSALLPLLFDPVGHDIVVLSLLPVVAAGWLLGMPAGFAAGLTNVALNWLLLLAMGLPALQLLTEEVGPDLLVVAAAGPVAGWVGTLLSRVRRQAAELARERETLRAEAAERNRIEQSLRESEGRLRLLFEQVPAVLWTTDRQLRFTSSAGAGLAGLKLWPEQATGQTIAQYFRTEDPDFIALAAHRRALKGEPVSYEMEWLGRLFQVHVEPFLGEDGVLTGTIGVALDLTEQRQAEQSLRQSEQRFRSVFNQAATGMALVAPDGKVLKVNRSLCELLGYSEEELLDAHCEVLTHRSFAAESLNQRRELLEGKVETQQVEKQYVHKLGHAIWAQTKASVVRDDQGKPLYLILEILDMTDRKRFEAQLVHLANHDPLTGLTNRRRFQEDLEHHLALARRGDQGGALVFLDLDEFKDINDSLGHRAGDQLLRAVARGMRQGLRDTDILARVGGDEFAVLLPQTDAAHAELVAERISRAIAAQTVLAGGQSLHVSASIGIALFPEHGGTAEELFACADLAMYQAKADGGNRWMFYDSDEEWEERITSRRTWEHRIREALEQDRFILCCQPIMDLRTERVSRYEFLLRMQDEDGKLVQPAEFMEVAERFGLIREIDRWVMRRAIHLAAELQKTSQDICLEVNLSGKSLTDDQLLPMIQEELRITGADPRSLVLEITETAAIADIERARAFIMALKELGFDFALDDFGVGFASLYSLKQLPVDYLKIDGSFIRQLSSDRVDQHMVKAIVEMAKALGKQTIAEFVSDQETLRLLQRFGINFAQGYGIGEPMPAEEVLLAIQTPN